MLLYTIFTTYYLHGQTADSHQYQVERDIERILEEQDPDEDGTDPEEMIRQILELAANPLNINRATVEDLQMVPGITTRLAFAIVSYRNDIKLFESINELTEINGIGPVTLERLKPYLTTGSSIEYRRFDYLNPDILFRNNRLNLFSRYRRPIQKAEGFQLSDSSGGFLGNPVHYYQRFHFKSDHFLLNLTQQKNPGEIFHSPVKFHHNTFHIGLHNLGKLQRIVIGDYSVRTGQGLILRSGSAFGKSRDVIRSANQSNNGPAIRGFSSANSESAFRGLAFTYGESIRITGFYSDKNRSATVVNGDTIRFPVSTIRFDTGNQLDREHNTKQQTTGGRFSVNSPVFTAGISGYVNSFDRPVQKGDQPYQLHAFEGKRNSAISFDYKLSINHLNLFGEAGRTGNGAYGLFNGLELTSGDDTEIAISYRHYSRRFQSIFGGSFAEQSGTPRNEEGFYIGVRHNISESIRISAYIDQFHFPAPRFQLRQPASGYDWLGLIEYKPNRDTELYLLARQKVRDQDYDSVDPSGRNNRYSGSNQRLSLRLHFRKQIHPKVRIRNRAEFVKTTTPESDTGYGYLVYQDIRYQVRHNLQIDARITFFETDGFEPRLYHFENDLLYVFSSTMLFDQGQRMYILFNFHPAESITVWLKAAATIYEDRNTIGSGRNRILGNIRSDVGIQVRIRM